MLNCHCAVICSYCEGADLHKAMPRICAGLSHLEGTPDFDIRLQLLARALCSSCCITRVSDVLLDITNLHCSCCLAKLGLDASIWHVVQCIIHQLGRIKADVCDR